MFWILGVTCFNASLLFVGSYYMLICTWCTRIIWLVWETYKNKIWLHTGQFKVKLCYIARTSIWFDSHRTGCWRDNKNNFIKQKLSVRILSAQNWAWSARSSSTQLLKAASMDFMSALFDLSWWRSTKSDIVLPRACGAGPKHDPSEKLGGCIRMLRDRFEREWHYQKTDWNSISIEYYK